MTPRGSGHDPPDPTNEKHRPGQGSGDLEKISNNNPENIGHRVSVESVLATPAATLRLTDEATQRAKARLSLVDPPPPALPMPTGLAPELSPGEARQRRQGALRELHARLAETFPAVFAVSSHEPLCPLKVGIHRDLAERLPAISKSTISALLRGYTGLPAYWRLLVVGARRVDLYGQVGGFVTETEARDAADRLARLSEEPALDDDGRR